MNPFAPFRDVLLVGQFEVLRALKTWRALALCALYAVATGGATYVFTRLIGAMENTLAQQLGVATTETPGAMLDTLIKSDMFQEMIASMVGSQDLALRVLDLPILSLFFLWFSFLVTPFFAATAASESIASDVYTRAIRFEALRTGRLELALGRFAGQAALTAVAMIGAGVVAWCVGMQCLRGHTGPDLAFALTWMGFRGWLFGLPFVGLGLAASQWTASAAWARVLAIGLTVGSWASYAMLHWLPDWQPSLQAVTDGLVPLYPQAWTATLWEPTGWIAAGLSLVGISAANLALGFAVFMRRDL